MFRSPKKSGDKRGGHFSAVSILSWATKYVPVGMSSYHLVETVFANVCLSVSVMATVMSINHDVIC